MKYLRKYNEMKMWGPYIEPSDSIKKYCKELEEQLDYLAEGTPFTMDNITVGGVQTTSTEKYVIRFKYVSDECDAVLLKISQLTKKKNSKHWSLFKNMIQKKINNISNEYDAKVKTELAKIFKRFAKKFDFDFNSGEQVLPDQMIQVNWGLSIQHLNNDTTRTPYLEVTVILTRDIKNTPVL